MVFAAVMVFGLGCGTWDVSRYIGELVLSAWIVIANSVNLAFVAANVPSGTVTRSLAWFPGSNVFYVLPSSLEQLARIFPGTPAFPISVEETESLTASCTKPGEKRCT